jgi:hypothetical protein
MFAGTLRPMIKRLAIILLMVLLPLQAAWGVVGGYCLHQEREADRQHFGHHVHQHQATDQDDADGTTTSSSDADCSLCHLGCVGVVTSAVEILLFTPTSWAASPLNRLIFAVFLQGPERPNWLSAV